jgi:hypothetical protein
MLRLEHIKQSVKVHKGAKYKIIYSPETQVCTPPLKNWRIIVKYVMHLKEKNGVTSNLI